MQTAGLHHRFKQPLACSLLARLIFIVTKMAQSQTSYLHWLVFIGMSCSCATDPVQKEADWQHRPLDIVDKGSRYRFNHLTTSGCYCRWIEWLTQNPLKRSSAVHDEHIAKVARACRSPGYHIGKRWREHWFTKSTLRHQMKACIALLQKQQTNIHTCTGS